MVSADLFRRLSTDALGGHRTVGLAAAICTGGLVMCSAVLAGEGRAAPCDSAPVAAARGILPVAFSGSAVQPARNPTNPREVLEKVSHVYRSMKSLQTRATVDIIISSGRSTVVRQETSLKLVRQPPRMVMTVKDPVEGTRSFYYDGLTFVAYKGITNTFKRVVFAPSLDRLYMELDAVAPQLLSPLVFAASASVPDNLVDLKIMPSETIGGQPTTVVEGQLSNAYMRTLSRRFSTTDLAPLARRFRLWVADSSYLIRAMKAEIGWSVPVTVRTAKGTHTAKQAISMNISARSTENVLDSEIGAAEFAFKPPREAVEVRSF
jgi:hypothetical protein